MAQSTEQPESFEQQVLNRLDSLETKVSTLETLVTNSINQMQKWDGRLWTLTLALITTSFAAIVGACAVVITRALTS